MGLPGLGAQGRVRLVAHRGLVALGNAEQHPDDAHRHPLAQILDEVETIGADERVETRAAVLPHLVLELAHAPRREDARHEPAVHRVGRRILEHHDAGRQFEAALDDLEDVAAAVGERLPVDEGLLDVGVPRQRPHVVALVVVDRCLVAQAPVRRERIRADAGVVGVVVDAAFVRDRHGPPVVLQRWRAYVLHAFASRAMKRPMRDLATVWLYIADTSCRGYSPLYDRICRTVAESDEVLDLVSEAPRRGHNPLLLLAAVHYLVLGGLDHPLAAVYAGASDADPGPLFVDVCLRHRDVVLELLATEQVNTNEVGRSAVIGPALTAVAGAAVCTARAARCRMQRRAQPALRSLPPRLRAGRRDRPGRRARRDPMFRRRRIAADRARTPGDHGAHRPRPRADRRARCGASALAARVRVARHRTARAYPARARRGAPPIARPGAGRRRRSRRPDDRRPARRCHRRGDDDRGRRLLHARTADRLPRRARRQLRSLGRWRGSAPTVRVSST